jgi:glycerophosphoryl diester phosphodiesterase
MGLFRKKSPRAAFFEAGRPLVFGHRGARGEMPENTLPSFDRALEDGADVLETDVRLTKDGVVVLSHDEHVKRMTDGKGRVGDYTLAELKQLDAGFRFTRDGGETFPHRGTGVTIPTLEEFFQRYPGVRVNLDLKSEDPALAEKTAALIKKYDRAGITMAGSFHQSSAKRVRRLVKGMPSYASQKETKTALIAAKLRLPFFKKSVQALEVPLQHGKIKIITPQFVRHAHKGGRFVAAWTVNDPRKMKQLLEMGVDGIITDYPARAAKAVRQFRK